MYHFSLFSVLGVTTAVAAANNASTARILRSDSR
jgi:hypothetical protein